MSSAPGNLHRDVGVLQPGYLPWLGYFDLVAMADVFIVYDDVQFDRGGWRNRNRVLAQPQPQWITVPVRKSGHAFEPIREVEIAESFWQKKHLSTLKTIYGRAPFFQWCYSSVEKYLSQKSYRWLIDLCIDGHHVFADLLGLKTPLKLSSEIGYAGAGRTERLVAICRSLNATRYIATNASQAYMIEPLWAQANIDLVYQNYPHPVYKQFSAAFISHLSVIDALMFAGPECRKFVGISHAKLRDGENGLPG